jgi:hypothetical protein
MDVRQGPTELFVPDALCLRLLVFPGPHSPTFFYIAFSSAVPIWNMNITL